jgi:uncharacterized protein (TIGR02996 family)
MILSVTIAHGAADALFSRHPDLWRQTAATQGPAGRRGWRFRFSLPRDVGKAFGLLRKVDSLYASSRVQRSLDGVHRKLREALGWSWSAVWEDQGEEGFCLAIRDDPSDLASWSAYADYLMEHGNGRGKVIAAWLSPARRKKGVAS